MPRSIKTVNCWLNTPQNSNTDQFIITNAIHRTNLNANTAKSHAKSKKQYSIQQKNITTDTENLISASKHHKTINLKQKTDQKSSITEIKREQQTKILVEGFGELVQCRRDLEALTEDPLLPLDPHELLSKQLKSTKRRNRGIYRSERGVREALAESSLERASRRIGRVNASSTAERDWESRKPTSPRTRACAKSKSPLSRAASPPRGESEGASDSSPIPFSSTAPVPAPPRLSSSPMMRSPSPQPYRRGWRWWGEPRMTMVNLGMTLGF